MEPKSREYEVARDRLIKAEIEIQALKEQAVVHTEVGDSTYMVLLSFYFLFFLYVTYVVLLCSDGNNMFVCTFKHFNNYYIYMYRH
jgi:hypothetical protein